MSTNRAYRKLRASRSTMGRFQVVSVADAERGTPPLIDADSQDGKPGVRRTSSAKSGTPNNHRPTTGTARSTSYETQNPNRAAPIEGSCCRGHACVWEACSTAKSIRNERSCESLARLTLADKSSSLSMPSGIRTAVSGTSAVRYGNSECCGRGTSEI